MIFFILSSAILYCLSFPNDFFKFGFWPAAWFALVPFFFCLKNSDLKIRLCVGLAFGICVYSLLLIWLWPVHAVGTLIFIFALTIQPVIFVILYRRFAHPAVGLLYIPSAWVASEWLRTMILNGFCFSLGNSQSFMPELIQLASLGGSYAVAFVVILVNYGLYLSFEFPRERKYYLGLALGLFLLNYAYGSWKVFESPSKESSISIAAIQPNISPSKKTSLEDFERNVQVHMDWTRKALENKKADVIVWPETAYPADIFKDALWFGRMKQLALEKNAVFIFGAVPIYNGENFNSAVVLDSDGQTQGEHHKKFLVPLSEYPWPDQSWRKIHQLMDIHSFDFTPGQDLNVFRLTTHDKRSLNFGVLICSESCYPSAARQLAEKDAAFIVVMLNDGWFKKPSAMMMHAQNAVMRAVETGRDVVSVANTGLTFRANHRGVIEKQDSIELEREGAGIFKIHPLTQPTVYGIIGDFFAEACALFVIIILLLNNKIKKIK